MTRLDKLNLLQDLVLDTYIEALKEGELKAMELAPIVTLLKNNKILEDKKITPESEVIEGLVEELK